MKHRIFIERPEDRDDVVKILARNGYTVCIGREKDKTKNKYLHYVEYWEVEK